MKSRIFISGADGFIGSHLTELLVNHGFSVTALAQYNSFNNLGWLEGLTGKPTENLKIIFGDIRDSTFINNVVRGHEVVIHLAALIAIPHSYVATSSYIDTNVKGTLNLLAAAKENKVSKFIHTSTSEVYGSARYTPIDEQHPLQGQSPYSASKIAADALVYSYYCSFDLPTITIRPFNTFGPRQSERAIIPTIISQVLGGRNQIKLGSLTPTRDLTYVSDTCQAFLKALESENSDVFGKTLNLGTGFEVSVGKVVELISNIFETNIQIEKEDIRLRPAKSEVLRLVSDNSLAERLLGWKPELQGEAGLIEGLSKTVEWFRKSEKRNIKGAYIT